jgi:hypothetical protein
VKPTPAAPEDVRRFDEVSVVEDAMLTRYSKLAIAAAVAALLAATNVAAAAPARYEFRTVGGGNGKGVLLVPKPAPTAVATHDHHAKCVKCAVYASVGDKTTPYEFRWLPNGGNVRVPAMVPVEK